MCARGFVSTTKALSMMATCVCILTLLSMVILLSSCASSKTLKMTTVPTSTLKADNVDFYIPARASWNYEQYYNDESYRGESLFPKYLFFKDSTIVSCGSWSLEESIERMKEDKYAKAGRYAFLNDSILEFFHDNGEKPIFYFDTDTVNPNKIKVLITGRSAYLFNRRIHYFSWELRKNGQVILPETWAYQFDEDMLMSGSLFTWFPMPSNMEFVSDSLPADDIVFRFPYNKRPINLPMTPNKRKIAEEYKKWPDKEIYTYILNLKDVDGNYLNVRDLRKEPTGPANVVLINAEAFDSCWLPTRLRFKKKGDRLILLNHDGSESEQSVQIYYPVYYPAHD